MNQKPKIVGACQLLWAAHADAQALFEQAYEDAAMREFPAGTRVRWLATRYQALCRLTGVVQRTGGMHALVKDSDGEMHRLEYFVLERLTPMTAAEAGAPHLAWYLPAIGTN